MFTDLETVYPEYSQNKITQYNYNRNRVMENKVSRFNDQYTNNFYYGSHLIDAYNGVSSSHQSPSYTTQLRGNCDTNDDDLFSSLNPIDIQSVTNPLFLNKDNINANLLAASNAFFPSSNSLNLETIEDPFDHSKSVTQNSELYSTSGDSEWYQSSLSSDKSRIVSDSSIHTKFNEVLQYSDASSNISPSATPDTINEGAQFSAKPVLPIGFEHNNVDNTVKMQRNKKPKSKKELKSKSTGKKSDKKDSVNKEEMRCTNCDTTNTPLWRKDVDRKPLCNACGLFLKLHGVMRPLSLKTDVIKKRQRTSKMPSNPTLSTNTKLRRRKKKITSAKKLAESKSKNIDTLNDQNRDEGTSSTANMFRGNSGINFNIDQSSENKLIDGSNKLTDIRNPIESPATVLDNNIGFNHEFVLSWTGNAEESKISGIDDVALGYNFGLMDDQECFDTFQI